MYSILRKVLVIAIITTVFLQSLSISHALSAQKPKVEPQGIHKKLVESKPLWIISAVVNSPWHGQAKSEFRAWYKWEFGSLASVKRSTATTISITAKNGESTAYLENYQVNVYDVESCLIGHFRCHYVGRYAELEQRLPGIQLWTYQPAGTMSDYIVPKVVTVINGQVAGSHYFKAIYQSCDDYIKLSKGQGSISITISDSTELDFEVNIGVSVGPVSLSGIAKGGLIIGQGYSMTYTFYQDPKYEIQYCIDYLGSYDLTAHKYPLIWAFSASIVSDSSTNTKASLRLMKNHINPAPMPAKPEKYAVLFIDRNGNILKYINPEYNITKQK